MQESWKTLNYLSPERAKLSRSSGGFLMLSLDGAAPVRVVPSYAFPLEYTEGFVVLCNGEGEELGMVKALSELSEEQRSLLQQELDRRYYCPKLKKILSVKTKAGLALWSCVDTEGRPLSITVKDAYKSMIRVNERRVFLVDRDGARYEIEDLEALDKKSYHKLELYL